MVQFAVYSSPIGKLLLVSDGTSLTGLYMDREMPDAEAGVCPVMEKAKTWLDAYFRGEDPKIDFPLDPQGTPFQKQVWQHLQAIPYGGTCTYGDIARSMGKGKMAPQAVGQAVGRNPISILIPCHRVVGAKGQLTGYAWGLDRKVWLLRHEKALKEKGT